MTAGPPRARRRRHRFRLSLNGLAIQISAFALSFTLVALMVVGSSRAAFVEENETVTARVPVGAPGEPLPLLPGEPAVPSPAPRSSPPAGAPARPADPEPPSVAQISLTDDSAGTAMFADEQGLAPGVAEQRCIRVRLDGDVLPGAVALYAAEVRGALAPYLDLVVEAGADGAVFGDCSGFLPESVLFAGTLAEFGAAHVDHATGLPAWAPATAGEARSFRFTVTVRDVPEAEGLSTGFGFSWEARA